MPENDLYVDSIKALIQEETEESQKIVWFQHLGETLLYQSHSDAMHYFSQSIELAEATNDTIGLVYGLTGVCDVYNLIGEYKTAITYITRALKIAPDRNYLLLSFVNSRLATVYANMDQDSLSFVHGRMSLKYNLLNNDSVGAAYDMSNMASNFIEEKKYDSAVYYYNQAFAYLSDTADILNVYLLSDKGYLASEMGKPREAIDYSQLALKGFKKHPTSYDLALEYYYMGKYYQQLGMQDSALFFANSSIKENSTLNNHELYTKIYGLKYKVYNSLKDYKQALTFARLEHTYSDSIQQINKENVIQSVKAKYELEEQQRKLIESEEDNKSLVRQRTIFQLLSAAIFVLLLVCVVVLVLKHKEHKRNTVLVVKLDNVNRSMHKLLSIIGHDLRDSVGNLKNFTLLMHHELLDNKSIAKMVKMFVPMVDSTHGLLETLLAWTRSNDEVFQPKVEDLSAKHIVEQCLEQVSHLAGAKGIQIDIDVEDVSFWADKNMLLTVLRNLVCNSIKFSNPGSTVIVKGRMKDENIHFSVIDEGVGMDQYEIDKVLDEDRNYHSQGTQGEQGSGLGISLCSSFISKHGGKLNIESSKGKGSTFSFILPYRPVA